MDRDPHVRWSKAHIVVAVVLAVMFGAMGACLVMSVVLLVRPLPTTAAGLAWRMFWLTASSAGVISAGVGGAVGFVLGLGSTSLWGSVLVTGLIAAVPGLLLGALVGIVLSVDVSRRTERLA